LLVCPGEGVDSNKFVDTKQTLLQGNRKAVVNSMGCASFNKLKITEISSKYQDSAFCLEFILEKQLHGNKSVVLSSIKTNSFFVHARSNQNRIKRKSKYHTWISKDLY
jgi:hypothetical protein